MSLGYSFTWLSNSKEENKMSNELVFVENNQVLTDSRKVAEYFEKRHDHVIRDIERCKGDLPKNGGVENAIIKSAYVDAKGESRPMYLLNRDGFMFVVMGFTGEKAAHLKWSYIQAFNAMEAKLKGQQELKGDIKQFSEFPISKALMDAKLSADIMVEYFSVDKGIALAKSISDIEKSYNVQLTNIKSLIPPTTEETGYLTPTKIGEQIGLSSRKVNKLLESQGFQYKEYDEWHLTGKGKQYGEKFPYENNGHSGYQIRWHKDIINVLGIQTKLFE